jgi:hypothetical protein
MAENLSPIISDISTFLNRLPFNRKFHLRLGKNKPNKKVTLNWDPEGTNVERLDSVRLLSERGEHVWLVANSGGQKGEDIRDIRAVFVDLDGSPIAPVLEWELEPHFIVETSPKRFHVYWIVDNEFPPSMFSEVQKALAKKFGGDPAVHDLPRLMRLPGTIHWGKPGKEPFVSRIIWGLSHAEQGAYSFEEIQGSLGELEKEGGEAGGLGFGIAESGAGVGFELPAQMSVGERNAIVFKLAASRIAKGLEKEEVLGACLAVNRERCQPALGEAEVRACVDSAWKMHWSKPENTPIAPVVIAPEIEGSIPVGPEILNGSGNENGHKDKKDVSPQLLEAIRAIEKPVKTETFLQDSGGLVELLAGLDEEYQLVGFELIQGELGISRGLLKAFKIAVQKKKEETAGAEVVCVDPDKQAKYEDYIRLTEKVYGKIYRDIFSEGPFFKGKDETGQVKYHSLFAVDPLATLRSMCRDAKGFSQDAVVDHIGRYNAKLTPDLLLDIPPWDGKDRIKEICGFLSFPESAVIDRDDTEMLIKAWGRASWERVWNPQVKNRALVFHGPQGIGKDVLLSTLTGGAGDFAISPSLQTRNEDNLWQAIKAVWFVHIEEFDRITALDPALIKAFLDAERKTLRLPYAKEPGSYYIRASFTGSCNRLFFNDYTGARRFICIELAGIEWSYGNTTEDKMQILSQYRELAEKRWPVTEEDKAGLRAAEEVLAKYLTAEIPENPMDNACDDFEERLVELWRNDASRTKPDFANSEIGETLQKVASTHGISAFSLRRELKRRGISYHGERGQRFRVINCSMADGLTEFEKGQNGAKNEMRRDTEGNDAEIPF